MTLAELSRITERRYQHVDHEPCNPSFQPRYVYQYHSLKDIIEGFMAAPADIFVLSGTPRYRLSGTTRTSTELAQILPGGLDQWALSGYSGREGNLILQFLPTQNEALDQLALQRFQSLERLADEDGNDPCTICCEKQSYLDEVYSRYAQEVIVSGHSKLWLERGEDAGEFVLSSSTQFKLISIETRLMVESYTYYKRPRSAIHTQYVSSF